MKTERLIASLSRDVQPVQPVRHPWVRTAAWTAIATAYLAMLVVAISSRDALAISVGNGRLVLEQAAALLTAITAAAAAFVTVVPGYRRTIILLPMFAFAAWIALVALAVSDEGQALGLEAMFRQTDWKCAATILVSAAFPGVMLTTAVNRGAPVMPSATAALAGLAAAAAGTFAVSAFRPNESSTVVLIWHCGTVLLLALSAGVVGRHLLPWPRSANR